MQANGLGRHLQKVLALIFLAAIMDPVPVRVQGLHPYPIRVRHACKTPCGPHMRAAETLKGLHRWLHRAWVCRGALVQPPLAVF